jgi:hypothetical protein
VGVLAWIASVPAATVALAGGTIRRRQDRVGVPLTMSDGRVFVPFRETTKDPARWRRDDDPAVLQPRFHLRYMGPRRRVMHAIFRRVCIVTTPFFVGIDGFRSKLWMVDASTGDFAGLYEWDSADGAKAYAEGLARVLRLLSVRGSVSYELVANRTVEQYLAEAQRTAAGTGAR